MHEQYKLVWKSLDISKNVWPKTGSGTMGGNTRFEEKPNQRYIQLCNGLKWLDNSLAQALVDCQ